MSKTKQCTDCKADIPKNAKKCMHCGTKQQSTSLFTWGVLILIVLIAVSAMNDNDSKPTPEQLAKTQAQANEQAALQAKKKQVHQRLLVVKFNSDKKAIIKKAKALLKAHQYSDVLAISKEYRLVHDSDLMELHSQAREQQLLQQVKLLPASKLKQNRDVYQRLVSIRPTNQHYKNKLKHYQNKINKDDIARAARQIAFGDPPVQSGGDGSYRVIEQYLKRVANDPDSIEIDKCTGVYHTTTGWLVGCIYRGKNAFGATVRNGRWYTIMHNQVIKSEPSDRYKW